MNLIMLQGSAELGLIYGFIALGVFISFRILNVPDLTADGTFTLGAACSATMTLAGHPLLGLLAGFLAGGLAGTVTGFLQTKLKIPPILAGILVMNSLYPINLTILHNRSNVSLLNIPTTFSLLPERFSGLSKLLVPLLMSILVCVLMTLFFKTHLGMCIRATGDNEDMVRSSSINSDRMKLIGLALSNALVALSGALIAQYQQYVELNMGIGMVVIALASLIIGEVLFGSKNLLRHLIAAVLGSIVYRLILALVLRANLSPNYLKLISSVIVVLALSYPVVKGKMELRKLRKAEEQHAESR